MPPEYSKTSPASRSTLGSRIAMGWSGRVESETQMVNRIHGCWPNCRSCVGASGIPTGDFGRQSASIYPIWTWRRLA